MKRSLIWLVLTTLGLAESPSLEFARLDLTDGRVLKNVSIKTYDPSSKRVLIVADGRASMVGLSVFPAPFDKQISSSAPRAGSSTMVAPLPPAPKAQVATVTRPAPNFSENRDSQRSEAAESAKHQRDLYKHAEAARTRANRYFKYEYNLGSGAVHVRSVDLDARDPEPISGWTGRYRTEGRVNIEFFDSRGWSYSRSTAAYEVITETRPDGQIVACDFAVKSTASER